MTVCFECLGFLSVCVFVCLSHRLTACPSVCQSVHASVCVCCLLAALSAADCTPGADGSAFFFMLVPRLLTEHLMLITPPSVASVADCMLDDGCRL